MKRLTTVLVAAALLAGGVAHAHPDRWLAGAVLGTTAGLVIANNVHGCNPWVVGTAGALIGGSIASHHGRYYHGYGYGYPRYYGGHVYDRGWNHGYVYPCPPRETRVIYVRESAKPTAAAVVPTPDLQPGVDLIKISVLHSNGIRTDVPILRVNGRFVGPQGESYESLPTTQELTRRYGM